MGIDIECDEHHYKCSYERWNAIRIEVIRASCEHVQNYKSELSEYEMIFQEELITFLENTLAVENDHVAAFIDGCNLHLLNLLIHFGLGGLFAFCNKSDDDGYYSVGNAYDICELFTTIKPYVTNNQHNESLNEIAKIFAESVKKKHVVVIY